MKDALTRRSRFVTLVNLYARHADNPDSAKPDIGNHLLWSVIAGIIGAIMVGLIVC